jgi:hypothetical protein
MQSAAMTVWEVAAIRGRYTSPENKCKAIEIQRLAPIAIAHDIATLCGEIERLRGWSSGDESGV